MNTLSCSRIDVKTLVKSKPQVAFYFKQRGCVACMMFDKVVKAISPKLKNLVVAEVLVGVGESKCEALANHFKVVGTPTIIYLLRGRVRRTWIPSGDFSNDCETLVEIANDV